MTNWLEKLYDTFIVDENYMLLLKGFGNTILITLCALIIGVVIGGVIAIAKYFAEGNRKLKFINWICDIYTTVIRGIPVTVLLMIFYFVILVSDTNGITTAIVAFGINSGAYMAELIRGGINAVNWSNPEAIIAEINEKVPVLKENGGFIFSSDHSIPNSVSLDNMKIIMNEIKKVGKY